MVSSLAIKSNSSAPHWETLDCQPGHKYLFSENKMTWPDARVECELYGAYLLEISGIKKNNCLLKYAESEGWQD